MLRYFRILLFYATVAGVWICGPADVRAQAFDGAWTGTYSCPAAPSGKNAGFSRSAAATVAENQFRFEDSVENQQQLVQGRVQPDGTIMASGQGQRRNPTVSWELRFAGKASEKTMQLTGSQANRSPCLIELSNTKPAFVSRAGSNDLVKKAADIAQGAIKVEQKLAEVPEKQSAAHRLSNTAAEAKRKADDLQARLLQMYEDRKKPLDKAEIQRLEAQAVVVDKELNEVERQLVELRTAADIASLRSAQAQDRAALQARGKATDENLAGLYGVIGKMILPAGERTDDWILHKAAIPIQQQEFCRIIDRFHDDLAEVIQIKNEIRQNNLYMDRQKDLDNLLPDGKFENWLVRVESVTQAADGSGVLLLQPPCRVMFGSDACDDSGTKVRVTIPADSRLFAELAKLRTRDFVAVSGRFLYVTHNGNGAAASPQYAIFEPGQYCSQDNNTKDREVFVTQVNYLVQLR